MLNANDNPLFPEVKNPIRDALRAILGKSVILPVWITGHDFKNLTRKQLEILQKLCIDNANPYWSTGIGIMDAAQLLVDEAVGNANIHAEK